MYFKALVVFAKALGGNTFLVKITSRNLVTGCPLNICTRVVVLPELA